MGKSAGNGKIKLGATLFHSINLLLPMIQQRQIK